ncbi:predicted protein [Arabidopsis lyrata subsp. lyrata]|uniref:Predicted protein n=1 Tax=Arabidopsis lyrata subsp. lyrata TaxID=81972 RepID=D7KAW9_ARALL|nr:predicted protein [Arabidopsis lyrata subsp. lyrata]
MGLSRTTTKAKTSYKIANRRFTGRKRSSPFVDRCPQSNRSLTSGGLKTHSFVATTEDREISAKETGFRHQLHTSDEPTHHKSHGKLVTPTKHIDGNRS